MVHQNGMSKRGVRHRTYVLPDSRSLYLHLHTRICNQGKPCSKGTYVNSVDSLTSPSDGRNSCMETFTESLMSVMWYAGVLTVKATYRAITYLLVYVWSVNCVLPLPATANIQFQTAL